MIILALPSISARISHILHVIYQSMINMNLYKNITAVNETIIKQQKIYSKIYLILFIGCLSIILFYTAIIQRTLIKTHKISTIMNYEYLLNLYSNNNSL